MAPNRIGSIAIIRLTRITRAKAFLLCDDRRSGSTLKKQLPFTFRYESPGAESAKPLSLKGVPRTARLLIGKIVAALGPEWQATIFVSHIILYRERRAYKHGQVLYSSG